MFHVVPRPTATCAFAEMGGTFSKPTIQFWYYLPGDRFKFQIPQVHYYKTNPSPALLSHLTHRHLRYQVSPVSDPAITDWRLPWSLLGLLMPVTSPSCHLHFWSTVYKSQVPRNSSLGSFHWFARVAHWTQETHLLPRFPVYYKRV